ncbi:MAG: ABC transporter permease [Propioniciclava sp.]|uniref:ABC transporter permease n=1 Tax=Propioniciclava sp. TaxID=2038686 RepID=UPI0039E57194
MRRVAWRLARRDLRVHRWRSLLIVMLVLLPVMAVTAGAVVIQSNQPTRSETVTRALGATQARLGWLSLDEDGTACEQLPDSWDSCASPDRFRVRPAASLADAAPPGYRLVTVQEGSVDVQRPVPGAASLPRVVPLTALDVGAPEFAGMLDLIEGRPASGTEVVVSRPWLTAFGVRVGDEVVTAESAYRIVGVVAAPGLKSARLYVPPGHPLAAGVGDNRVFLVGENPLTWEQVRSLNRRGVGAFSRAVVLDAPALAHLDDAGRSIVMLSMAGALGATLLMFVAGSAFAVGVRSQRRQLGLLGAVGATVAVLRRIVLTQAVLLGGIGAALGVMLGIASGFGAAWGLSVSDTASIWGYHVPWLVLPAVAAVGIGACVVAAWAPARSVAKVDALEAVRSAEVRTPPARVPLLGVAVTTLGAAVMSVAVMAWHGSAEPWALDLGIVAAVILG